MFSKEPGRRQLLAQFLDVYKTHSGEATVNAVFGKDLANIDREFQIYIEQRSWRYMIEPAKPDSQPPALQPASAELVEASLGFLALGSERPELARQHARKAIDLDPDAPEGHALLAYLEQRPIDGSESDAGVSEAQAAVQRGSRDGEMFRMLGDSYLNGSNSTKPDAAQAGVGMYENAINSNPRQLAYYDRLAVALFALQKPREEDAKFLAIGMRAFPGNDWLRVGGAVVDERLGRHEAALTELEAALRPDSRLDPAQRGFADQTRSRWLLQAMQSEISGAENKGDFSGARAILSRYQDRITRSPQTDRILKETDDRLAMYEGISRYDALLHDGKRAEARALAQQLLTNPDLPDNVRRYLQGSKARK
jgi:tetratricopeptide (TPR) repeat protein